MSGQPAPELVTVSEAARRLGVDKGLISRQVKRWGLKPEGAGRFDLAAYESLRRNALSPIAGGRRRVASPAREVGAEGPLLAPAVAPAPAGVGAIVTATTEHKSLQADLLRLELDERRGRVVARADVSEAIETVSRQLRDRLLAIGARVAAELGSAEGARVKVAIDKAVRGALDELVDGLARALAGEVPGDASEDV